MRLWLLRARRDLPEAGDPWEPWYDKVFGFVIAAETEEQARAMATERGGDEIKAARPWNGGNARAWLDADLSICRELRAETCPAGVALRDYASA